MKLRLSILIGVAILLLGGLAVGLFLLKEQPESDIQAVQPEIVSSPLVDEDVSPPEVVEKDKFPSETVEEDFSPKVIRIQPKKPPDQKAPERIKAIIEQALSSPPFIGYRPIPPGVRVLDVQVGENKITIDLSKELLSEGTGPVLEDALHQILTPINNDPVLKIKNVEYYILVERIPLHEYFNR